MKFTCSLSMRVRRAHTIWGRMWGSDLNLVSAFGVLMRFVCIIYCARENMLIGKLAKWCEERVKKKV